MCILGAVVHGAAVFKRPEFGQAGNQHSNMRLHLCMSWALKYHNNLLHYKQGEQESTLTILQSRVGPWHFLHVFVLSITIMLPTWVSLDDFLGTTLNLYSITVMESVLTHDSTIWQLAGGEFHPLLIIASNITAHHEILLQVSFLSLPLHTP